MVTSWWCLPLQLLNINPDSCGGAAPASIVRSLRAQNHRSDVWKTQLGF